MKLTDLLTGKASKRTLAFQTTTTRQQAPKPEWATSPVIDLTGFGAWRLPLDDSDFTWLHTGLRIPFLRGFTSTNIEVGGRSYPLVIRVENVDSLLRVFSSLFEAPADPAKRKNTPPVAYFDAKFGTWEENRPTRQLVAGIFFNQDEALDILRNYLKYELFKTFGNLNIMLIREMTELGLGAQQLEKLVRERVREAWNQVASLLAEATRRAWNSWKTLIDRVDRTIKYAPAGYKTPDMLPLPPGVLPPKEVQEQIRKKLGIAEEVPVWTPRAPAYLPAPGMEHAVPADAWRRIYVVAFDQLMDIWSKLARHDPTPLPKVVGWEQEDLRKLLGPKFDDKIGEAQLNMFEAYLQSLKRMDIWKWMPDDLKRIVQEIEEMIQRIRNERSFIEGWATNRLSTEFEEALSQLKRALPVPEVAQA